MQTTPARAAAATLDALHRAGDDLDAVAGLLRFAADELTRLCMLPHHTSERCERTVRALAMPCAALALDLYRFTGGASCERPAMARWTWPEASEARAMCCRVSQLASRVGVSARAVRQCLERPALEVAPDAVPVALLASAEHAAGALAGVASAARALEATEHAAEPVPAPSGGGASYGVAVV
jgi:hypothetical protein